LFNKLHLKDVNVAEKIFGPDIGALVVKQHDSSWRLLYPITLRFLKGIHNNATLCTDGIKINGLQFLSKVSRNIIYRTAEWVPSQASKLTVV
jgi:hypothetical protein